MGDGSFTADDKRARRRLVKEFHKQGFTVRSVKIEGDGYKVTPVGEGSFKTRKMGSAPVVLRQRRQFPQAQRRYPGSYRGMRLRPGLRPYRTTGRFYRQPPRAGQSVPGKILSYGKSRIDPRKQMIRKQQEQDRVIQAKKTEQEITEKQRKERIQAERQETVKQLEKQRFERAKLSEMRQQQREERERQNRERTRQLLERAREKQQHERMKQERHADFDASRREIREHRQEEAFRESHTRKQETPNLQEARQNYVTKES